ncbi:hypothetical protein C0995_007446 [Termitomyces sp. Mi166|nr:hypothetical protein C0995_007446 [Termitomyces sp. Mi166\
MALGTSNRSNLRTPVVRLIVEKPQETDSYILRSRPAMQFPVQSQLVIYLALIYSLFLSINRVNALPLFTRENGATTVQTVHTSQTPAGQLTETCDITLTPITDKNGEPAVEEVKKCSLALDSGTESSVTSSITTSTTTSTAGNTIPPSSTTMTATSLTQISTSVSGSLTTATSDAGTSSLASRTSTASGMTTSTALSTPTSSTVTPSTPATNAISASTIVVNGVSSVTGVPTETTSVVPGAATPLSMNSSSGSGTAAADTSATPASESSAASFQLPGKKISVLPIGLGVFAGISVIALIVVGLVTYERTKYRKAFRQRRLAETGAAMGYGGMA